MFDLKKIPSPLEMSKNFVKYNWLQLLYRQPFPPRAMCFYVTYRCNMRCRMCGIWKHKSNHGLNELTLRELDKIFSNSLFSKIEHLDINGGEPSLRKDLFEIIEIAKEKMPHLKHITMSSNGLFTTRVTSVVKKISEICRKNKMRFSIVISLHGVKDVFEKVCGVKDAFSSVTTTIKILKSIQAENNNSLSINCVLTDINLIDVYKLENWCQEECLPISFVLGEVRARFLNFDTIPTTLIAKEKKDFLIRFIRKLSQNKRIFNPSAFRYYNLANLLEFSEERTISCHYAIGGNILGPTGELYYCPHSKAIGNCRNNSAYDIYYDKKNLEYRSQELQKKECKKCPPYTFNKIELEKDILRYLKFLVQKQQYNSGELI
jgi:MoaA/NifB/PqqE/SkfB family radical SAM enzyme